MKVYLGPYVDNENDFNELVDFIKFIENQVLKWQNYGNNIKLANSETFGNILSKKWESVLNSNEISEVHHVNDVEQRLRRVFDIHKPIEFNGFFGNTIKHIFQNYDFETTNEVISYLDQKSVAPYNLINSGFLFEMAANGLTPKMLKGAKKTFDYKIRELDRNVNNLTSIADNSKSKIESLEKTYEEKLKLSAPARYWRNKIKKHNYKHEEILVFIIIYLIGSLLLAVGFHKGFFIFAHEASNFLLEGLLEGNLDANKSSTIIFARILILAFSTIFVSTLFFWPLRHLVRMLLSEEHLASDATYKDALLMTYLALIKKDGINQDKDRQIALEAIFKQPQDGLVKDDGLPNWMPSAWFNKIK